jgi:hypothetical protein
MEFPRFDSSVLNKLSPGAEGTSEAIGAKQSLNWTIAGICNFLKALEKKWRGRRDSNSRPLP